MNTKYYKTFLFILFVTFLITTKESHSIESKEVEEAGQDKGYFLQVGQEGKERLNVLNNLVNPSSQEFLKKIGLKPGITVLELGCGTGEMAIWIAKQISPGKVIAIDNSSQQIAIARKLAQKEGVNNIEFKVISAYDLDKTELKGQIDLIFSRFVLNHLVAPLNVLYSLKDILKTGGILVIHDMIASNTLCYPENKTIKEWLNLLFKYYSLYKKDPNIGIKLVSLFNKIGLNVIDYEHHQALLKTPNEKLQIMRGVLETRQDILDKKMLSEEAFATLISNLKQLASDSTRVLSFPANMIVAGKKLEN